MYISSEKPDVKISNETKNTYRPIQEGSRIKNKFREIQKWDVGFRYADSIKKHNSGSHQVVHPGSGSAKKPHIRKAHWHHYWVGSKSDGNRRLILKWVSACPVNVEFDSDLPIVSHRESKGGK